MMNSNPFVYSIFLCVLQVCLNPADVDIEFAASLGFLQERFLQSMEVSCVLTIRILEVPNLLHSHSPVALGGYDIFMIIE